jgi:hypothetical protein
MWPLRVSQILTVPSKSQHNAAFRRRKHSTIFRTGNHPFSLAVKCDSCDVSSVAFESEDCGRVGGLDIVELDFLVAGGGEKALVG